MSQMKDTLLKEKTTSNEEELRKFMERRRLTEVSHRFGNTCPKKIMGVGKQEVQTKKKKINDSRGWPSPGVKGGPSPHLSLNL